VPPRPLIAEVRRQMLRNERADVGERGECRDLRNDKRTRQAERPVGARYQWRGPLSRSIVTRAIGDFAGGSSIPPLRLQASQGMPAPHSHASAHWLVPLHGRSGHMT
jgi:hypothetical protein